VNYCCLTQVSDFSAISWQDQAILQGDDVRFVLDQHTKMDFYTSSSLKQQFVGRHVTPL